ncbi:phosphate ABC transporter substrate-binding protein PstS [Raineyella sp.]|uniref:phosphate ABC transporter substrate-binding protein PstS n=1 Tax=Raineyella sp. TaxID=1911550 RepID=UPI002B1EAA67|nr:phosphate ABC transporter substrate-binding protein PstS [Raineyella sp.]MEA5155158.1 phosphate ABC transporter substrate-binding protein PstS [Raineyella sp.]
MKISRVGASVAAATALVLGLSACSTSAQPGASASKTAGDLTGTLSGGGSSAQESAVTAWIDGFKKAQPGVTVQYNPVGSGSGRTGFLNGQYLFAGSDAALKSDEWEKSKAICGTDGAFSVPAYISPIAVAYNLPSVKQNIQMDAATIAKIFAGRITTWNDPAIADQNPGVALPNTKITVVHRADDSGTTQNFTDYLSQAAPDAWPDKAAQTWPAKYTGQESAQQTTGVVSLAQSTEGAIVYADASAIGSLGTVAVKVGDSYVKYSPEAAARTVAAAKKVGGQAPQDMAVKIDRTSKDATAYPIVLLSYHIYCTTYKDQATADRVKAFGTYALSAEGQQAAADAAGSAPLSGDTEKEALAAIASIKNA